MFGSSANSPCSSVVAATEAPIIRLKDFEADKIGGGNVYWCIETAPDEWSIFGSQEYPLAWHVVAKKLDGIWFARTSENGLAETSATTAPEAITIALEAYAKNRIPSEGYSPIYGFPMIGEGIPARLCATFWPDPATVQTDAPGLQGLYILFSRFTNAMHWATGDFRIDLAQDRESSTVVWPEDFRTNALIFYNKKGG
jgi:hypothetical protein